MATLLIYGSEDDGHYDDLAVALKEADTEEFKTYAKQIRSNCNVLVNYLLKKGYCLSSGGSDNHFLLWNLNIFLIRSMML